MENEKKNTSANKNLGVYTYVRINIVTHKIAYIVDWRKLTILF